MYDLEEQEKVEALKAWWAANRVIVGTLLIGLFIGLAGFQSWRQYRETEALDASASYAAMVKASVQNRRAEILAAADKLTTDYAATPYSANAALLAARAHLEAGEVQQAKQRLQWVIEHTKQAALRDATRLYLAGVLLDDKDPAGALQLLQAPHDAHYTGLYDDLLGDVK
ncbi:MAG: YfgM family protein, partial [Burkholderiales bacterium]